MNRSKRIALFETLWRLNPDPATELQYDSPFELLVAVVLSAQATDQYVNKATKRLFMVANTPEAMHRIGVARLRKMIRTIGLYNTKAANLMRTCDILIREHGSRVPAGRDALQRLPGVGRKTANVVLNTAFGVPAIAVDTHIFRVANRTKLAPGKNVWEVEERLNRLVPDEFKKNAHHWLILHGRYTCTARSPKCAVCPIFRQCEWSGKGRPGGTARRGLDRYTGRSARTTRTHNSTA